MRLRKYQSSAVAAVVGHLRAGKNTLLVSPTGSGKAVMGAAIADEFKRVLLFSHRREILEQSEKHFGPHVCIRSVQSLARIDDDRSSLPKKVNLVIVDEAHRSSAATYQRAFGLFPDAVRLGLTATARRADGKTLGDTFQELVEASSVKTLIERGFLVPYRAFVAPVEALDKLRSMKRTGGDFASDELSAVMNDARLVGDVVREYKRHAVGRRAVAFAVSIEHSMKMADAFNAAGVKAVHVDGKTSPELRSKALADLAAGHINVLCNVDLFTEGLDCPPASCVIMARPTLSETLYLQSVGRGFRPYKGKVDLVILDHAGNIDRHGEPDIDRGWSLQEKAREPRPGEAGYCPAWVRERGFNSLEEYELEEKRFRSETYSLIEVATKIGKLAKTARRFLAKAGIEARLWGSRVAYDKRDIDAFAESRREFYSFQDCLELFGEFGLGRASVYAIVRILDASNCRQITNQKHYRKDEIDRIVILHRNSVTEKVAIQLLGFDSFKSLNPWRLFAKKNGLRPCMGYMHSARYLKSDISRLVSKRST